MYIENKHGITSIEFEREIQAFCPMGNDYYTATINVCMEPGEKIMDYCETDEFIKSLGGKSLIIEDLVATIYTHIIKCNPKHLSVSADAKSNVHFPVVVTKDSE